jgi:Post-segregation antitoxin CcdA
MTVIKKTVSLSSDIVDEVQALFSNFSLAVETALKEYLHHYRVQKALESFGKWESRDKDSVALINELREEKERRKHVKGSH